MDDQRGSDRRTAPRYDDDFDETDAVQRRPTVVGYDTELLPTFEYANATGLDGLLGLVFDLLSPDRLEAHLDVEPRHHTPFGHVHGGTHAAIVESVGSIGSALRVLADGRAAVGVNNSTDFLRPVTEGRLHAVGTPVFVGRTQHLWLVEVRDDRDRLAARGQLRTAIVDRPG